MPTMKLRAVTTPERELLALLNTVPDTQVRCRAGRHKWPFDDAVPGKPLPRGISARPQVDGTALIVETCARCGKERRFMTGEGGALTGFETFGYSKPKDWVQIPREYGAGPRTFRREQLRRLQEQIGMLVARANAQVHAEGSAESGGLLARAASAVPVVKFQGGGL
jgi:hypothetical protein